MALLHHLLHHLLPRESPSFQSILIKIPGTVPSVHTALYLPTENQFMLSEAMTSRHTQTNHPPSRETAKPSTKSSRPIRPLFPPCPWQSGFYPQGPVRHLPPSSQQPRSQTSGSRSKQQNQSKLKTTSDQRADGRYPADSPPPPPPNSSPCAFPPPPPHGPALIEELQTSTAVPSSPPATATSGPEDRSSLNF